MQICIANDKFKGSISASGAAEAIRKGLVSVIPEIRAIISPMADGGDGSLEILHSSVMSEKLTAACHDPLLRAIEAPFLIFNGGRSAFVEMAAVSGINLLSPEERDPVNASTYGLGEMIRHILDMENVSEIVIGLGGSATNDAGTGMLQALGVRFFDRSGKRLEMNGGALGSVDHIDTGAIDPRLKGKRIIVASDVESPLTGPDGATYVFGPQKGASRKSLELLEDGMDNFRRKCINLFRKDPGGFDGSGAAGGTAASLVTFLNAEMKSGWEYFSSVSGLEEKIASSDLVISGEGRFDTQSFRGKVICGVDSLCRKYGKQLWVFCGEDKSSEEERAGTSITRIFSISDIERDRRKSMDNPGKYLERLAEYAARAIR